MGGISCLGAPEPRIPGTGITGSPPMAATAFTRFEYCSLNSEFTTRCYPCRLLSAVPIDASAIDAVFPHRISADDVNRRVFAGRPSREGEAAAADPLASHKKAQSTRAKPKHNKTIANYAMWTMATRRKQGKLTPFSGNNASSATEASVFRQKSMSPSNQSAINAQWSRAAWKPLVV